MWQWASIRPGMIHLPAASITSTALRSSSSMSPGSAPTLLMRLPSTTMASLRLDGLPEPSISVPLRITRVLLAALIGSLPRYCFVAGIIPQRLRVSCPGQRAEAMRGDDIADLFAAVDMGAHHGVGVAVKLGGAALRLRLELRAQI